MNKTFLIASFAAATVIAAFVALAAPGTEVQASSAYGVKGDRLPIQKFGCALPMQPTQTVASRDQPIPRATVASVARAHRI
jgi:hypothetical protein